MKTSDIFVAVDAIILSEDNKVLLIKRTTEPFKGMYCLPGGYVGKEELLKDAIKREVKEETGLEIDPVAMLGVYDEIKRDPRHRTITMTYLCRPAVDLSKAKFDYNKKEIDEIKLFSLREIIDGKTELGFDHFKMLETYYKITQMVKPR